jgi:hypothetical protein
MTTTTDFGAGALASAPHEKQKHRLLRDLNSEYRDTQSALSHAAHSVNRALKLNEENYHRKRKAILANGHGQDNL